MEVYTNKPKFKRKQHTKIRYMDRTTMLHSIKQIIQEILNKKDNIYFAKRLSHTKSMVYVEIEKIVYKVVWSKDKKIISSFLPMETDFKYEDIIIHEGNAYNVTIYPDCFYSTNNKEALTTIENRVDNRKIYYNHPLFETLFDLAFNNYKDMKECKKLWS